MIARALLGLLLLMPLELRACSFIVANYELNASHTQETLQGVYG